MALMEEFTYQAVSPTGGPVVKGTLEASGANAVALKLRAQGLMPLKIQVATQRAAALASVRRMKPIRRSFHRARRGPVRVVPDRSRDRLDCHRVEVTAWLPTMTQAMLLRSASMVVSSP